MKGLELKEKLKKDGVKISWLAKQLGYTPERLLSALKAKNVRTELIEKIASITNKNVSYYMDNLSSNNNSITQTGNNNSQLGQFHNSHHITINEKTDQVEAALKMYNDMLEIVKETQNELKTVHEEIKTHCSYIDHCLTYIDELKQERNKLREKLQEKK